MNDPGSIWNYTNQIFKKLPTPGVLLVTGKKNEKKNIMTIGWIELGYVWKGPVISVLIRPSRYTYKMLDEYDEFSINILSDDYKKEIAFCGASSGSYCDKFKETGLHPVYSGENSAISIKEADLVIECKTLYKNDIDPKNLSDIILARYYSNQDYHRIITASILGVEAKIQE
jgi:flavin reductase (DIM6/NTAB) family NADH-FMN oxidoreductase RutF